MAAVLLWSAATLLADEKSSRERSASAVEDSLAAAKRDLETINATKTGTDHPKTNPLTLPPPEIHFGPTWSNRAAPRASPAEAAKAKKTANWLVDAMAKQPERADEGRDFGQERKRDADGPENAEIAGRPERISAQIKGEAPDTRPAAEPVTNPLEPFMAGWMTPQDFKLLQPGFGSESASDSVARGERPLETSATNRPSEGYGLASFNRAPVTRTTEPVRENPFLQQSLPSGYLAAPVSAGPAPIAPAGQPAKVMAPPIEPPAQKSGLPAFVKPNDDAKYFKPMKRF